MGKLQTVARQFPYFDMGVGPTVCVVGERHTHEVVIVQGSGGSGWVSGSGGSGGGGASVEPEHDVEVASRAIHELYLQIDYPLLADRMVALINSKPRSPTRDEIIQALRGDK